MAIKIINTILILFAAYMGIKHGWAGVTGKAEIVEMFQKWNIGKTGVMVAGIFTLLSVILILIPQTFVMGNFMMAASILFIICQYLNVRDFKGVLVEIPFLLLNLVIIYLGHPLRK
jgi:hypothetical protein